MSEVTQAHRQLAIQTPLGEDVLLLTSFSGEEEMGRLFSYHLEMLSGRDSIPAAEIVGKRVSFRVELADGTARWFNGLVSRFSAGDRELGMRRYQAEVVPWLWFLTRTADCRIFQEKSIPQIIEQIFADHNFSDYELSQVKGSHEVWEYCVQYRETDFNFISRLMEQEGIFYYFRHKQGKHTLVLADQKGAYVDCPEKEVEYESAYGGDAVVDRLTDWEHTYAFTPGKWAQTDYNFKDHPARSEPNPSNLLMTNEQTSIKLDNIEKYEIYDYPGEYSDKGRGANYTKIRMEEEELAHDQVGAGSTCRTFFAGGKFKIKKHDCEAETGRTYVITGIKHSASEAGSLGGGESGGSEYSNTFTCIPDSVTFRSGRTTPKPVVQGVQAAVVVGPAGQEIWPDEFGRVKVQFFWDREGKRDENSSCWIRVSQEYAGKNWGSMCIPRIGQEVIVQFVEGDPDHPLITGRVYNADQMPPYALPDQKVVSGLKSYSSPGGGGYNEFIMDDTKGNELIRVHGQYDMDSTIEHDLREHVLNDRSRDVTNNETILVGVDRTKTVGANETLNVGKDRTRSVGQNETVTVALTRTHTVGINEAITVGAAQEITVGATRAVTVGASQTINVGANQSVSIGANLTESVGGSHSVSVEKDNTLTVGKNLAIDAGDQIVIKTGKASITMKKDGTIEISGKDITIKGSGQIDAKASKDMILKGKKILQN
jgi:type VI secretion system secreted protein VgrG